MYNLTYGQNSKYMQISYIYFSKYILTVFLICIYIYVVIYISYFVGHSFFIIIRLWCLNHGSEVLDITCVRSFLIFREQFVDCLLQFFFCQSSLNLPEFTILHNKWKKLAQFFHWYFNINLIYRVIFLSLSILTQCNIRCIGPIF